MEIFILDKNKEKLKYLEPYFYYDKVKIVENTLSNFLAANDVECIVSPANSFGLMDGGYDAAIIEQFGPELQKDVQKYIIENYFGEQPVGTSFIIKIKNTKQFLIHTPTMRTPQPIKDKLVIYQCMRSTLMCALKNGIKSIVIPLFGGATGGIHPQVIAEMMKRGYDQINHPPKALNWDYVETIEIL